MPKHSAYRSGIVVRKYKEAFARKHGRRRKPYTGPNPAKSKTPTGLTRWFAEDWRDEKGKVGYSSKSSIYRPTKRITKKTPTMLGELSEREIRRAKREKARTGRVKKFRKSPKK